jgi:predicted CoA-binding protein
MSSPSIAVVGASADRSKFGNKCVRAYLRRGYRVFPVNPRGGEIEGQTVYPSLEQLPAEPDRISLYLPPAGTRSLLPALSRFPGAEVWFNPGTADPPLLEEARRLGVDVRDGCSIVDAGLSPSQFP